MKMAVKERDVQTSGLEEVADFKIKVSGKAFRILLDGLYSNKIKAILRELGTNAYDSHLMAGCPDKPFDVQIPTSFDPTFRVRDYGTGMTHEQVMGLYSTLFDSSKDSRNDQVGMLGLGSKSPFAYVDTFTATSWQDGTKRVYTAWIDADGVPRIALMPGSEVESDEPNGFEVSIAANVRDCGAFVENAAETYRWFPVKPNFLGREIEIKPLTYAMEGKGWKLIGNFASGGYYPAPQANRTLARQGCVVYPIDGTAIPGLTEAANAMLSSPFIIDFPIGTLDVAPSREALSYNDTTCRNIMARLNSVAKEITDKYAEDIQKAPTLWEAGKVLQTLLSTTVPSALKGVVMATRYKGTALNETVRAREVSIGLGVDIYRVDRYRAGGVKSVSLDYRGERSAEQNPVAYGSGYQFFVRLKDDIPSYEGMRIRQAWDNTSSLIVIVAEDEDTAKKAIEKYGNPEFKITRDLPKPVIVKTSTPNLLGKTKKDQIKVRELDFATGNWSAEKVVDLDGEAYFVMTKDSYVRNADGLFGGSRYHESDYISAIKQAHALKYFSTSTPVYAISQVYQKRLDAYGKWISLPEVILAKMLAQQDALNKAVEAQETQRALNNSNAVQFLNNQFIQAYLSSADGAKSPLHRLMQITDEVAQTLTSDNSRIGDSISRVGRMFPTHRFNMFEDAREYARKADRAIIIRTLETEVDQNYPMLSLVGYYQNSRTDSQKMVDYIRDMDRLREFTATAATAAANTN